MLVLSQEVPLDLNWQHILLTTIKIVILVIIMSIANTGHVHSLAS